MPEMEKVLTKNRCKESEVKAENKLLYSVGVRGDWMIYQWFMLSEL